MIRMNPAWDETKQTMASVCCGISIVMCAGGQAISRENHELLHR